MRRSKHISACGAAQTEAKGELNRDRGDRTADVSGPSMVGHPLSLSVAPPPRMTERRLTTMHRVLSGHAFADIDEANAFLQSPQFQGRMKDPPPVATSLERAQEAAYDAWETPPPRRYELASRALAVDERCSDAWLILAEQERSWLKQRRCFEKAVAAAERTAAEQGWLDPRRGPESDSLYGHLPARAFFRAKMALARFLMDGSYHRDARVIYEELLRRDRNDHMGARYEVIQIYHADDDHEALGRLLDEYREDTSAFLSYERVWLGIVRHVDGMTLKNLTREALRTNPHVPAFLLGIHRPLHDQADYVTLGGEDEAEAYAGTAVEWWLAAAPATQDWLVDNVNRPKAGRISSRKRRTRREVPPPEA